MQPDLLVRLLSPRVACEVLEVRKPVQRPPDAVEITWTTGKTIVAQCAGKTFLHPILSDPDGDAPEFSCLDEDPVIVTLSDDEQHQLAVATS
jgi:hypothetical protein